MKYQPLHDLIDPDVPPKDEFEFDGGDGNDEIDGADDAFVMEEDGTVVKSPSSEQRVEPTGPKPWAMPVALLLGAAFVVLTVWNLSRLLQGPPPPPELSPFQVKQALYMGVMRVDAYRRTHGTTPATLEDAGLPTGGPYLYRRVDSGHYVLAFSGNGPKLEYDSTDSRESFFGPAKALLTMGETR